MRKLVKDATKRQEPIQSNFLSFSKTDPTLWLRRRHIGRATKAMIIKGKFNQNIHLQFDFSAHAPPMTGPVTLPMAHCRLMSENHFPRSRSVTMSVTMTYVRATIPPPPIPWTDRPTRSVAELLATEAMIVPIVKITMDTSSTGFRPMICENEAHDGWKTVEVRRNEVPAQKASIAVPLIVWEMI
jgi:hypothetical protein